MSLQVLQRYDQSQENPWKGVGDSVVDSIKFAKELEYKKATLDNASKQLAIQARTAATEEEKVKLEKQKASIDSYSTIISIVDRIKDPEQKKRTLVALIMNAAGRGYLTDALQHPDVQGGLLSMEESPADQHKRAEAAKSMGEARGYDRLFPPPAAPGSPVQNAPNSSAVSALDGQAPAAATGEQGIPDTPVVTGGTLGPFQYVMPQAAEMMKQREAAASARGTNEGKKMETAQDIRNNLDLYYQMDDQIHRGSGLVGRKLAGVGSFIAGLNQGDLQGAIVREREKMLPYLGTALARIRDVGNLTEQEQENARKLLAGLFESQQTKELGKAFLYDALDAMDPSVPNAQKSQKIKKLLADAVAKANKGGVKKGKGMNVGGYQVEEL